MAGLTCPNCNAVPSTSEMAAGWCDSCGKKIPSSYAAATTAPRRAAREALLGPAPKALRHRKRFLGTLICVGMGALLFGILSLGPLRGPNYILLVLVGFATLLVAITIGQMIDGMFSKTQK